MRIGLFTDCYFPQVNGVVTSVMLLKESLEDLGHEVFVITVKTPHYDNSGEKNVIRVPSVPFAKWKEFRVGIPTFFHHSFYKIKSLNLDIIHTHTEFSLGLMGRFFAKYLDLPLTHTYHTMYEDYTHYVMNLGQPVVKSLMKKSSKAYVQGYDTVIVPSKKTYEALRQYGVTTDIAILPTGIDVKQFSRIPKDTPEIAELRNHYGLLPEHKVLLSLGRVSKEKSVDFLIEAMPKILSANPNVRLLVVGDGPYKNELHSLVSSLGLNDYIIFTGRIPFCDVIKFYSLADVFVNASKTETQGLTIFEAMASNLPVIVYDDTNVADVVINGNTGRLFRTPEEYCTCVKESFEKWDDTLCMARKGKEVIDSLSKEAFGKRMQELYAKMIERRRNQKEDVFYLM